MSNGPVAWQGVYDPTDLYFRKPPQADVRPLYTHDDTALLQQCLKALEYYRSGEDYQPTPASKAIAALRERLEEKQ